MENSIQPIIYVIAPSGKGKTTSIRNMNPKTTMILNVERKPLPFPNANEFTQNIPINKTSELIPKIKEAKLRSDITAVVVDTFSKWVMDLEFESRSNNTGFDVWNFYNEQVFQFLKACEDLGKPVFVLGHDEIVNLDEGKGLRRMAVEGRKWPGKLERYAIAVFFANARKDENNKIKWFFETQTDGVTSAKSPMGLFEQFEIDNDLQLIMDRISQYYKIDYSKPKEIKLPDSLQSGIANSKTEDELLAVHNSAGEWQVNPLYLEALKKKAEEIRSAQPQPEKK